MSFSGQSLPLAPYGMILWLDETPSGLHQIAGGAVGTAVIYTDSVQATHVIRRAMMRLQAWMNYINPY
ncbi:MAG: hypothetical protein ACE5H7_17970 [Acidiferrobacterales bacterium]